MTRAQMIAIACRKAGCDEEHAAFHMQQFLRKGWDPHPPEEFVTWWVPRDTQELSGASIGGHMDATRVWARKDPGGWVRRRYGIEAELAWNMACYRESYDAWHSAGSPQPDEDFVSVALPLDEQKARWQRIEAILGL
jgi:hypothetical protein